MLARLMFAFVNFRARKGLAGAESEMTAKERARRTGIRGEAYAYWYLRRHGYVLVARNFRAPGIKGEIDMVGYDGDVLAFIEVKTRAAAADDSSKASARPEDAVNLEKRRNLSRMARQFLRARRIERANCRFDVMAVENHAGTRPQVRLHKGAFTAVG